MSIPNQELNYETNITKELRAALRVYVGGE